MKLEQFANAPDLSSAGSDGALAYVIEYANNQYVAFSPFISKELIDCPDILKMPVRADYSYGLIEWRNQWLPLIDIDALINNKPIKVSEADKPAFCLVLAYLENNQVRFAAVASVRVPDSTYVKDSDFCSYLPGQAIWPKLTTSCFTYKNQPTPIVDSNKLFGQYHAR